MPPTRFSTWSKRPRLLAIGSTWRHRVDVLRWRRTSSPWTRPRGVGCDHHARHKGNGCTAQGDEQAPKAVEHRHEPIIRHARVERHRRLLRLAKISLCRGWQLVARAHCKVQRAGHDGSGKGRVAGWRQLFARTKQRQSRGRQIELRAHTPVQTIARCELKRVRGTSMLDANLHRARRCDWADDVFTPFFSMFSQVLGSSRHTPYSRHPTQFEPNMSHSLLSRSLSPRPTYVPHACVARQCAILRRAARVIWPNAKARLSPPWAQASTSKHHLHNRPLTAREPLTSSLSLSFCFCFSTFACAIFLRRTRYCLNTGRTKTQ